MSSDAESLDAFREWCSRLPSYPASSGPAGGTIAAALVVLERLREDCALMFSAHQTPGGHQLRGVNGPAVAAILARYGETRPFLREGGRTNRGGLAEVGRMLNVLKQSGLNERSPRERNSLIESFQRHLVEQLGERHFRQHLKFTFNRARTTWQSVNDLLRNAKSAGKEASVAQHLVGATLQLRYPGLAVENLSFGKSESQRAGDFQVRDTAFHVTVTAVAPVYEKCQINLRSGLRPWILVPDRILEAVRQNTEFANDPGRVSVESLECFIGGIIERLSTFASTEIVRQFRKLLELYNSRVQAVEPDQSMLIEIPPPLLRDLQLRYQVPNRF